MGDQKMLLALWHVHIASNARILQESLMAFPVAHRNTDVSEHDMLIVQLLRV
jgi:hypothetical protein